MQAVASLKEQVVKYSFRILNWSQEEMQTGQRNKKIVRHSRIPLPEGIY
jgi:hypothetical protein